MSTRGKVMIVDDEPLILEVVRARLEGAGFEVITRNKALGTSQAIMDECPDILLLDLQMPALGGESLTNVLKKNDKCKKLPIILHSTVDLLSLQKMAEKVGAIGAIVKTGDDAVFLAHFERLFERAAKNRGGSDSK